MENNVNNGSSLSIYIVQIKKMYTCRVEKKCLERNYAPLFLNNAYNALTVIVISVIY